jgi:hypothetical protein
MNHAIQLEAAFQWYQHHASDEARSHLNTREKWFAAMRRINSTICERALSASELDLPYASKGRFQVMP